MYSPSNSSFLATSFSLLNTTRGTCENDSCHLCHVFFFLFLLLYNTKNVRPNITLESPTGRSIPRQPLSNGHLGSQPTLPHTPSFIAECDVTCHAYPSGWLAQLSCLWPLPAYLLRDAEWVKQRESPHTMQTLSSNNQMSLWYLLCFKHKSKTHTHC